MSNKNITQLPVNTNLSTIEGFAAVDIGGANVQISGQSIINSIDAVTSVLSSNTALLTVTGGNVPTITVNTAPIAKGGTGLATADQIATYVINAIGSSTLAWVTDANGIYYDAGNVGIGMSGSSVNTKLQIEYDDATPERAFRIKNTNDGSQYNFRTVQSGGENLLRFDSDNTGISPLVLSSANKVGIGTNSLVPEATLHIYSTSGSQPIVLVEDEANPDATPFIIDIDGKVGIGTDTPLEMLHLKNPISSIRLEDTQGTGNATQSVSFWESTGRRGFLGFNSGFPAAYELYIWNDVHGSSTKIYTTTTGGTTNIGLTIDGDQNVSMPNGNLDVNGGITASGIPSYNDDAAAGVGGLSTGEVYQTTGAGAAPLNVAGILMIKQ